MWARGVHSQPWRRAATPMRLHPIRTLLLAACASHAVAAWGLAQDPPPDQDPRCLNCEDEELAALLRPSSDDVETVACEIELVLRIDEAGEASAVGARKGALPLCALVGSEWSSRTRWEPALREGVPTPVEVAHALSFSLDRDVKPRCLVRCSVDDLMNAVRSLGGNVPGMNCSVELSLRVDVDGTVTVTDTDTARNGDGDVRCERLFRRWAVGTRWVPAYLDGQPTVVEIKQRVTARTN